MVVLWSACSPSTLSIWVQILLNPIGFSLKCCLRQGLAHYKNLLTWPGILVVTCELIYLINLMFIGMWSTLVYLWLGIIEKSAYLSDPIVIFLCKLLNLQRLGFQYLMPVSMITLLLVSSTTGFEFSHIIMIFHCVPTHMLVLWPNEVRLWGRSIDGVKRCQIFRNIWQHGIWQRSIWQRSIWQRSVWQGRSEAVKYFQ